MTAPAVAADWRRYGPELRAYLADRAKATDLGETDVRDTLRYLGERDLLGVDAGCVRTGIVDIAELIELAAGECGSSAFSFWAHRMVIEYLRDVADDSVLGQLRQRLLAGTTVGSTAMAAALQEVAGLREVPVIATPEADGFRLAGTIRWASNLVPGAAVVLAARVADTDARLIAVAHIGDPGVSVAPAPKLLAMNATVSSAITLADVRVDRDHVVSEDLRGFVARVRPVLLLLQTAFCVGLATRALDEARAGVFGTAAVLTPDIDELTARLADVVDRSRRAQQDLSSADAREVTQLRFDVAQVAMAAARLEATIRGGMGYATSNATNRRLREAAFLPVQSPSETQLRWELARSSG